jgi:transposase
MMTIPSGVRIMLATRPVDFRRGAHSLAALAAASLGQDPFLCVVRVSGKTRRSGKNIALGWQRPGVALELTRFILQPFR